MKVIPSQDRNQGENDVSGDRLESIHFPHGIVRGSLIEIFGDAKITWLPKFLREQKLLKTFWLEREVQIQLDDLHRCGVDLRQVTFASSKNVFQMLSRALRNRTYQLIIAPSVFKEHGELDCLQRQVEKSGSILFLWSERKNRSSYFSIQMEVIKKFDSFEINWHKSVNRFS